MVDELTKKASYNIQVSPIGTDWRDAKELDVIFDLRIDSEERQYLGVIRREK